MMNSKSCYIFIVLIALWKCGIAVEVTIDQGILSGSSYFSRNGTKYYGFLGIPFAKPPTGELRFEPPQPPEPWHGLRNATRHPSVCLQKNILAANKHLGNTAGSEDCLYLSVYTPAEKTRLTLPVMVYVHGGAFSAGSSVMYDPKYFMDYEVVTVFIQYRLHILGFLSTGDEVIPGNNGMKDQVAALKWVQKNIAAFGGDPNKVTIFGQSSGAASVHYHLYSPLSKGLFHRAISQSGSALASWAHIPRTSARRRAQALGVLTACPTKNSRALVNCLKKIPAEELIPAFEKFYVWELEPMISFSIVTEPEDKDAFITENPWHRGVVNKVPWIVGCNSADGGLKVSRYLQGDGSKVAILGRNYKRLFPISFQYASWIDNETRIAEVTEKLKQFYFGDKDINVETIHELVRLFSDGVFVYDVMEAAKRYDGTAYFYYYDHRNERSFNDIFGKHGVDLGVSHGDELISLFHLRMFPAVAQGDDFEVSQRLVKYWINFANEGNPNTNGEKWLPIKSADLEYLHITTKTDEMKRELLKERYQFWKSLELIPPSEGENSHVLKHEL